MIDAIEMQDWPEMVWCARVPEGSLDVDLLHGHGVEIDEAWAIEGVWAGRFSRGGFDRTSLVFGSGVRSRDDHVTFVSAGSNVDRLWSFRQDDTRFIANSLPALIAVSGTRLLDRIGDYPDMLNSVLTTVGSGTVEVPAEGGSLKCTYFDNLKWDGHQLHETPKPSGAPQFDSFQVYHDFLFAAARRVGANATDEERDRPFGLLTTVTSGYDSSVAAVLAREAGCERAVTIQSARSVVPRSDSGEEVAEALGMECKAYPRGGRSHEREIDFWAATGTLTDANMAVFEYPKRPCLLFSGAFGGCVWTLSADDLGLGFRCGSPNTLGFCEFRLRQGIAHFPVPYCGARRADEIFRLSHEQEMEPWILGGEYDRPIPRRIAEEAGVPRNAFGMKKSATQYEQSFQWPYRSELQDSYRRYLEERNGSVPWVRAGRALNWLERQLLFPIRNRMFGHAEPAEIFPDSGSLLFQWANHRIAAELESAFREQVERVS